MPDGIYIPEKTEAEKMRVLSALEWRTDRVNALIYGPPGSGKSHLAAGAPHPLFIDMDEGAQTIKYVLACMGVDAPVVQPDPDEVLLLPQRPQETVARWLKGSKFENYPVETVVVDTVSSMETDVMIDLIGGARPEIADFGDLFFKMRPFFYGMRKLPYNTLLLAHDYEGAAAIESRKEMRVGKKKKKDVPPGPALTGQLRRRAPGMFDFFVYLTRERVGDKTRFWMWTDVHPDGYPARVRGLEEFMEYKIENPGFHHFREALDRLESYVQQKREQMTQE